jgi:hypothetical protein
VSGTDSRQKQRILLYENRQSSEKGVTSHANAFLAGIMKGMRNAPMGYSFPIISW